MEIDYFETSTNFSVTDLLREIQHVVDSNPHVDFSKVGVFLNDEYTASRAKLDSWVRDGKIRMALDIS